MQLSFNLDDIHYLKLDIVEGGKEKTVQLALKEKREKVLFNFLKFINILEKLLLKIFDYISYDF